MIERASNKSVEEGAASEAAAGKTTIVFEDAELVERCRKGDMEAFGRLVAKYQDRIFNVIYRMCGRRADAEELAQETFLKALERIGQFRGQSRFYTWLFRIATNLTISRRRRDGRIRFCSSSAPDEQSDNQAAALTAAVAQRRNPGPEAAAVSAETRRRVSQAIEELDDDYRVVVILRDIEEMDYARIAEVINVPQGTVKSRLHRARCSLREKLADLVSS